jgi:type IV pilus assembly protein PilX
MAANLKNHALSFQAAEAALRQGEAWVGGLTEPPPECARAPCSPASVRPAGEPKPPIARDRAWWTHNARAAAAPGGVSHKPRFIVARRAWQPDDRRATCTSYSDACTGRTYFSVAVRATGIDDTAVTILRSVFSKRFR